MKTESDTPDKAQQTNRVRREWQAPVLTKESTANTKTGKLISTGEVMSGPGFGPAS